MDNKGLYVVVALVCVAILYPAPTDGFILVIEDCYKTWRHCSGWSSGATRILRKSCENRCKEQGHNHGHCTLVHSKCPWRDQAYQCQCS